VGRLEQCGVSQADHVLYTRAEWEKTWITTSNNQTYLKIVGLHTMLSVMIVVLKDHSGHESESLVLQQAVSAALQALQTYISAGQEALKYLVNHTCVMVAYAAGLLLKTIQQGKQVGCCCCLCPQNSC
jgi:hypothetical protein